MLNNLSIGMKIVVSFALILLIYGGTFVVSMNSLSHLNQTITQIESESMPLLLNVEEMDVSRSEVQQFLTDVSATHDRAGYKQAEESANRFLNGIKLYKEKYYRTKNKQGLQQIIAIEKDFNRFYASGKLMAETYITKGIAAGNLMMQGGNGVSGFDKDSETIAKQLEILRVQQMAKARAITSKALNTTEYATDMLIKSAIAALVIMIVIAIWLTRSITRPLRKALKVAIAVANGDLTQNVEVRSKDETGRLLQALKDMNQNLSGIVTDVRQSAHFINNASQEIAHGNMDLSSRTEEQAASLEETSSSMDELAEQVKLNVESAKQAYNLTHGTCSVAEQGEKSVESMLSTMNEINEASSKIEGIVGEIEGISFQTNILALNAAVEAARAGEQGRGFAVVAGEVRNLAQRSAVAAKEIKTLIDGSVEKVNAGTKQAADTAEMIGDVHTSVQLVSSIMKDISSASSEQSMSINQINSAIVQIDTVTQQNAALVEEASAATESMNDQASALLDDVEKFQLASDSDAPEAVAHQPRKSGAAQASRHTQEKYAGNVRSISLFRKDEAASKSPKLVRA